MNSGALSVLAIIVACAALLIATFVVISHRDRRKP